MASKFCPYTIPGVRLVQNPSLSLVYLPVTKVGETTDAVMQAGNHCYDADLYTGVQYGLVATPSSGCFVQADPSFDPEAWFTIRARLMRFGLLQIGVNLRS